MHTSGSRTLPACAASRNRPIALPGELVCGRVYRVHAVEERYDTSGSTDSDKLTETFHNLKVLSKCLHAVSTRGETFTTIEVQCPQKRSNQFLRLKIYTVAQGNALPVRTFRQMYGYIEPKKILTPIGQTTLTA